MKMIKRELVLCLTLTACVFVCALAWGSPFLSIGSGSGMASAQQQTQTALFKGTVLRNGEQFLLSDASGQILRLDDPQRVQDFEGKTVTITGRLDQQNKMIHVERIESATV
jgi:Protein of unknown function (DUF5818)